MGLQRCRRIASIEITGGGDFAVRARKDSLKSLFDSSVTSPAGLHGDEERLSAGARPGQILRGAGCQPKHLSQRA